VRIWDSGEYETDEDPADQLRKGKMVFVFHGKKLKGEFALVKFKGQPKNWLLIKADDEYADEGWKLETVLKV